MRKLKLQVQITLDGFVGGPNGELDWATFDWDDQLKSFVGDLTEKVDGIVLGRKLAEGFIPYWATVAANADNPEQAAGRKFTETPKVVFSRTLAQSEWPNTEVAAQELVAEIARLKQQPGQDLMAYGGATFVSSLVKAGLIDEYYLFVSPVAIGRGLPIFQELESRLSLRLLEARPFACGIVVLHYAANQPA